MIAALFSATAVAFAVHPIAPIAQQQISFHAVGLLHRVSTCKMVDKSDGAATPPQSDDEQLVTRSSSGKTSGRRVGGTVRPSSKPVPPTTTTDEQDPPLDLLLGIIPLAFFLLAASSLFGLNKPQASSFSYSFSSYSESAYRNEDGKVETRSDSQFSTNIPGLAERMAQEDAARRVFPMEKQ